MTDLSQTIAPKSDQLNSDDLITGPITIRVSKITANLAAPEQPISIFYDGDNGKPYKPCKSMRRVLVNTWGADGTKYTGRSMTLYRDPEVKFGGIEVGGIRISHMTDIARPITIALTASKANRKPYTVKPLQDDYAAALVEARKGMPALEAHWKSLAKSVQATLKPSLEGLKQIAAGSAAPGSGEAAGASASPDAAPAAAWGVADWYGAGVDARTAGLDRKLPEGIPADLAMQDAWLAGYDETAPEGAAAEAATA